MSTNVVICLGPEKGLIQHSVGSKNNNIIDYKDPEILGLHFILVLKLELLSLTIIWKHVCSENTHNIVIPGCL